MDDAFIDAMTDVFVSWMVTYVIETEQLTKFRQWLINRPELWECFRNVPDEDVFFSGIAVFLDVAQKRNAERKY